MYNSTYIATVSSYLDRLQVFKQVFSEHIKSCERIVRGKSLASENTTALYGYLLRNLARFVPFSAEFTDINAPEEYANVHAEIAAGLVSYERALTHILVAMHGTQLDQRQFMIGVSEQQRALDSINFDYFDNIRYWAEAD